MMSAPSRQDCQSSVTATFFPRSVEKPFREGVPALGPAGMNTDFLEVEKLVEKPHIPIGGSPSPDVSEHFAVFAREVLGAKSRHSAGPHFRNRRGVDDRLRHAGARVKKIQQSHLGRQTLKIVVDVISHDLHTGENRCAWHHRPRYIL